MTFRRVLVATDFSDNSAAAAALGSLIAAPDATFRFVHVMPAPLHIPFLGESERDRVERTFEQDREDRGRRLEALRERVGLPDAEGAIRAGSVASEITQAADEFDADLVVIAAHRHSFAERLLLGSKAKSILRAVQSPLLVAKVAEPSDAAALRRIGVATDFYEAATHAGEIALRLAEDHDAELIAIHAVHPDLWAGANTPVDPAAPEGALMRVDADWLDRTMTRMLHEYNEEHLDGRAREVTRAGKPVPTVSAIAEDENLDLLTVGTHGPSRLERALLGSIAAGLVDKAPCSVLVVR